MKALRSQLVFAGRHVLDQLVRETAGSALVTLHHDISPVSGEEVLVFTLASPPDATSGSGRGGAARAAECGPRLHE
ncbi:MAG: DUF2294 family protein [Planctomycetes bacterium]|nr:DUF2294 family protein [Planctomycetota bacterium]MBM4058620.1 DUF2294 family protein [Planctomycetota bacterium]